MDSKVIKSHQFSLKRSHAWLQLTNRTFTATISIEEILDQPIFLT